jgi:hypothetical protein
MSGAERPPVAQLRRQFEAVKSLLDEHVRRTRAMSFVVGDRTDTVEVTVDGQLRLTGLFIDPGILGLGAREVTARINEALRAATDLVDEWFDDDLAELEGRVADALAATRDPPPPT